MFNLALIDYGVGRYTAYYMKAGASIHTLQEGCPGEPYVDRHHDFDFVHELASI
jgi:hypothetical protein